MSWPSLFFISLNLVIGYLVFIPLNKNGRHLQLNRFYLLLFPFFAIAIGMIQEFGEGSMLTPFTIELPLIEISDSVSATAPTASINWILWIYSSGVLLSTFHFIWSLYTIRTPKDADLLQTIGKQRIYLISSKAYSFSHFNAVYLSDQQLENAEYIIRHELAHAQQKHSIDLILFRLVRTLLWFHPVMYLWESRIKENHEYLADRACIENEKDVQSYSYALLSAHFGTSIPNLANGFNRPSLLQKRIIQLKTQNTFNMKKIILIPTMLTAVVLMTSVQLEAHVTEPSKGPATSLNEKTEDETKPEFVGGMSALIEYMQANIQYPKDLENKNIEAKVFVKFVVTKSGDIENVKIARGSEHEAFNEEATRVVSNMPNWTPGTKNGKTVSAEMTLPIQFALAK